MIHSIYSSSSSTKTLSAVVSLAIEEEGSCKLPHNQPPNTDSQGALKPRKRLQGKAEPNGKQYEELLADKQTKYGPGARSATPPIEDSFQDKFFGLSQEYSFAHFEIDSNPNIGLNPALKSKVEDLPETSFYEHRPQAGRSGIDQYLATPRREDADL
ncbi:hypothetical protein TWF718_006852 [Orbilia javanica]|uniref:Uncharacterized protein n=1 Tax=Orbilia javanica TaxID=47235 RepID=A0AAN8MXP3_9PEZI